MRKKIGFIFIGICLSLKLCAHELVLGTTFTKDAVQPLLEQWNNDPNNLPVRTLNRTSHSLAHLLATANNEIDLIISSSPMFFYNLLQADKLARLSDLPDFSQKYVPVQLRGNAAAFSLSGYGILYNAAIYAQLKRPEPQSWQDLADPALQGLVVISSPTRSETNHIIIEGLLQKYGWQQGWSLINRIMTNVGTIASRSFGVADKIQANLGAAGITIDSYANMLLLSEQSADTLKFHYVKDFPTSPALIAVTANSRHKSQAKKFLQYLLGKQGQNALLHKNIGKYPVLTLSPDSEFYALQQYLLSQPQIDYELLIKRQALIKLLFEHHFTYRLNLLRENWGLLYQKERELGKTLPELRNILIDLPVSELQANDADYLAELNKNTIRFDWQKFYAEQQTKFLQALEAAQ